MSWKIWKWTAKHNAATFHIYELSNPSFQKHLLQINVCSVFATDVLLTETLKQTAYSHSKTKETLKGRLVFQNYFFGEKCRLLVLHMHNISMSRIDVIQGSSYSYLLVYMLMQWKLDSHGNISWFLPIPQTCYVLTFITQMWFEISMSLFHILKN